MGKEKTSPNTDNINYDNKHNIVGMRIIKTVVSVFISVMLTNLIGGMPVNSAVSSLLTIKDSNKGSREYGKNRIIGTFVGAIFSLGFVFVVDVFAIELFTVIYYLAMSILLIPIIKINVILNSPEASGSACVVFLLSLMSYVEHTDLKYNYVMHRIIGTFVGVMVAIIINKYLPDNRKKIKS